ncbi:MAG: FAD-dependent oxidoreductase [Candidatus ainarchaeum sp.]|nr:FAD-dependent oxidoreductase [Candidatus ainarchaeum sp.]
MYDVIIIGAGPAGLTAGLYCARYGLKTIILEKGIIGGTATLASTIQNWPGIKNISGFELMNNFKEQVISLGVEIKQEQVLEIKEKKVITQDREIESKAIIIAVGSKSKWLKVKGEKEFLNKGVHFCATCDGAMYQEKEIVVIGHNNRAVEEANYLKKMAKKVYLISSKNELTAEKAKQDSLKGVEIMLNTNVIRFEGTKFLEKIVIKNNFGKESEIRANAAFVYIGTEPNSDFVKVKKDKLGRIIVDEKMQTNKKGIFAIGDCIKKDLMQIITASAEGAIAAHSVANYLK